jgi:hypothetical protein
MKMIYKKNPFREFMNINSEILKKDYTDILNSFFKLSKSLQEISTDNEKIYFSDLINMIEFDIPFSYSKFITNYNENITLIDNLNNNNIIPEKDIIYYLIENRIFLSIPNK